MTQPVGTYDPIRRALEYLMEAIAEREACGLPVDRERLLDEAGMRFNLSPNDTEALARLVRKAPSHAGPRAGQGA